MKRKLYQFSYVKNERGIQIQITFCAFTYKDACSLLDVSMYTMRNHGHRFKPKDKECIINPFLRYAKFDDGELCNAMPNFRGKLIKLIDLQCAINEYRKNCHAV